MAVSFAYYGLRARKARFARKAGKVFALVAILGALSGAGLLYLGEAMGWLLIGVAITGLIVHEWYLNDLVDIAPESGEDTIEHSLESTMLAALPRDPSPRSFAEAMIHSNSALFLAVRFGLSPNMIMQMASNHPNDLELMWSRALEIRGQNGDRTVTGAMVVAAIIDNFHAGEQILGTIHLDRADIDKGIAWHKHIGDLVKIHKAPRRTGGIARDWSFGYVPLLNRFGQNLSRSIIKAGLLNVEIVEHIDAITQMFTYLDSGRQNAVLVGKDGAGKSTVIHAFAERLLDAKSVVPSSLRFRQVILLDASSLVAAAPGRGQLEQLVMEILGEAHAAKNIIICLDNAHLFFEDGIGSVDLSAVLQPVLDAGRLRIILSMDEQRFLKISQQNPGLANTMNRIMINDATEAETMAVMQDQLLGFEYHGKVTYTYQALKEAYRLSERYVHDLAMPGRAVKLLESAAAYAEGGLVTMNSVQSAIEKTTGVKVGVANEAADREKLLNLESEIHQRMIGQNRAVSVVSDALRRARAGVRNTSRPIGTFLFLGPTGVGKTELSKALAEVYYGGEDNLVRLDLNEYVQASDVTRLIADGADDPTSLTAQVMKQPFSVVLLDEIEKAAPEVLTTLLQLLDEGVLRDVKNREVSFRDTIVIATSNAGAERIREYIDRGYKLEQFEQQISDELISSGQFRPEFLNRFDEIVVFGSLSKPELLKVVDLIIAGVNKTLSSQKITVKVAEDAKQALVDKGYDPRLGARPMRRVVQRAVENTVATQLLSGVVAAGGQVDISLEQVEQILGTSAGAAAIITENTTNPRVQ